MKTHDQLVKAGSKVQYIPIPSIKPNSNQPRREFDMDKLHELAESIAQNGILQPLTVRRLPKNEYELISGERRLRASLLAGLAQVPCIIIEVDTEKSAVLALLENLQREDLGFFEQAQAIAKLISVFNLRQEDVAAKLGKSQSTIANKVRLLKLTSAQRELINQSGLTERHARALLRIDVADKRDIALKVIVARKMNVAQTEQYIESILNDNTKEPEKAKRLTVIKDIRIFFNTVDHAVKTMRDAGIIVEADRVVQEEFIEYTIRIPNTAMDRSARAC